MGRRELATEYGAETGTERLDRVDVARAKTDMISSKDSMNLKKGRWHVHSSVQRDPVQMI